MSRELPNRPTIMPAQEWRQRVIDELDRLTERVVKLRRFIAGEEFYKLAERQQNLLKKQSIAMNEYADILSERLGF